MDTLIATLWSDGLEGNAHPTLQEKLHTTIRRGILSGALKKGARLPATRALAARLGIARNTVIEAYDKLVVEGYLETRQGAGTFVTATTPDGLLATNQHIKHKIKSIPHEHPKTPLYAGMPAIDQFPIAAWARYSAKAARAINDDLMYYVDPMGYLPLRQNIVDYLAASRSVVASADQVMITSGLQQGLYLLAKSIMTEGQSIFLEDPGYWGALASAKAAGLDVKTIGIDEHSTLRPGNQQGLLLTCPSRQFPLGYTMPHSRRLELLSWAQSTDSLILEDDYDSEFRYAGRPLNSLQGIDGGQHVIYVGTFSKSIFPALRIGYLILPERFVEPVTTLRRRIDSYPAITNQITLNSFIESGEFARHIRRLRKVHSERQDAFIEAAQTYLKSYFIIDASDTGLHLVARPTDRLASTSTTKSPDIRWAAVARDCEIGAMQLSITYHSTKPKIGVLLSFANIPTDQIEERVKNYAAKMKLETNF